jgi:hypothetical protein
MPAMIREKSIATLIADNLLGKTVTIGKKKNNYRRKRKQS